MDTEWGWISKRGDSLSEIEYIKTRLDWMEGGFTDMECMRIKTED